ncbi:hypothetical protein LWI29_002827 [Acer saccharum]|uniref:F-box/LRR-repeat protein 15/At3g58940/PEG3-like LRR domain-containing protein n=1 Tax=Acer saccharum TaxID=4024 RepID=A0AA39W237_ACESA|nr:hypothetical protein LWI29_002827 [Acer saccharum]
MDGLEINQKKQKLESDQENQNSDRLSALHDSILYYILSFLPTKYVVQTSILGKRWLNLWTSLPYLNFDTESITGATGMVSLRESKKILNFVNKFLQCHVESSIIRFRLSSHRCAFDSSEISSWISTAVSGGVEELDIRTFFILDCPYPTMYRLPRCLLNCNSLVKLKLSLGIWLPFTDFFCFPKLKSMYLQQVIVAKNFYHQLLNCPNLENLVLKICEPDDFGSSQSSDTFQDLTDEQHLGILTNLDDAFIGLYCNSYNDEESVRWISKFLRRLSNVKTLHLNFFCTQFLQYQPSLLHDLSTFCNLNHLVLELGNGDGDVVVVACLLQFFHDLQSLRIIYRNYLDSKHPENKLKPEQISSISLPGRLKTISVEKFIGRMNQLELLRLLLENEFLEKIIVHPDSDTRMDPMLLNQELLGLPKLSKLILRHDSEGNFL